MRFSFSSFPALVVCTACSTTPILPAIDEFAESVKIAGEAGSGSFKATELKQRVDATLRLNMLSVGAFYGVDDDSVGQCILFTPLSLDPGDEVAEFDDYCAISAYKRTNGTIDKYVPILPAYIPDENPNARLPNAAELATAEFNASLSLDALARYVKALGELAKADSPQKVAKAASDAVTSVGNAVSTAAKLARSPLTPKNAELIPATSSLVGKLLGEVLEAQRYSTIASIVLTSDETVTTLSRNIANWFWLSERKELIKTNTLFRSAVDLSVVEQDDATDSILLQVETTRDAARAAQDNAVWRTFWNVAVAHRAIADSLKSDSAPEQLAAANTRIQALVDAVRNFTKAVEASQE